MIPKICALGLLLAFVGVMLSEVGYKSKKLFSLLAAVAVLSLLGGEISSALSSIMSLGEITGISEIAATALKIVGLGYVFGVSSDIIKELSEPTLASFVTVGGRIEILIVVLPYFVEIIELGIELIK